MTTTPLEIEIRMIAIARWMDRRRFMDLRTAVDAKMARSSMTKAH